MNKIKEQDNKFEIAFSMSDQDIEDAIQMDYDTFSDQLDMGVFSTCKEWQNKNPEIFITLKVENELVGHICFMPLKKSTYQKYKLGLLHDSQLSGKDIETYKPNHKYNCLFCSIIIKEEYRDGEAIKLLLGALQRKILELKIRNIEIERILADCVTEDGVKLVTHFGFSCVYDNNNTKIYELDKIHT